MANDRPGPRATRTPVALTAGILAAATVLVFGAALRCGFVFDDIQYVTDNPRVRQGLSVQAIEWAFTSFYASNWHPLTWVSHLVDVELFGLRPWGHHLANIVLHTANVLLLLAVSRALTGALVPSVLLAALFALHPLHVESAAWVAQRKDLLSTCFFLLALGAWARYASRPAPGRYGLVCALFAAGLLSKPMLVTFPFVLLLLDWWPLGRLVPAGSARARGAPLARLLLEKAPLLILSAFSIAVTLAAQQAGGAIKAVAAAVRVANALRSYVAYLGKMLFPVGLSCYYPLRETAPPVGATAAAAALLFVLTGAALLLARRRPWLLTGWLWYLGTLVPVIGLVQVGMQSMADRYTYIPLIGPFLILAWEGAALSAGSATARRALAAAAVLVLLALGAASARQVRYWQNALTLNAHALEVTADNWMAHANLGGELSRSGRKAEALPHLREAVRLSPYYAEGRRALGAALFELRQPDEAVLQYQRALDLKQGLTGAHLGLAAALASLGRSQEAVVHYTAALRERPDDATAHLNLGNLLDDLGQTEAAISHYRAALALDPGEELHYYNLGLALHKQGRLTEAEAQYREAVRLKPDSPARALLLRLRRKEER